MHEFFYIKRLIRISPLIAVRKLRRKLFSFLSTPNRVDSMTGFERELNTDFKLKTVFSLPSIENLSTNRSNIFAFAERTANLEFSVFGSGWKLFEDGKIDWQSDFISDFSWSSSLESKKIKYGNVLGADIKVPWELGRMQFLPCLAIAFHLSDNEVKNKYSYAFETIVSDFIDNNLPGFGVQWISSMDVALRISNLLLSYDLFIQAGATFDFDFENKLKKNFFVHAEYIYNHPEWNDGLRGNHYLACLTGLILISACFPKSDKTAKYLQFAQNELIKEIDYQFNDEGSNFEDSTAYHFLSSEIVITGLNLLKNYFDFKADEKLNNKIRSISEFCFALLKKNNSIDLIGDNDSGRFFRICHPFYPCSNDYLDILSLFQVFGIEFPVKFDSLLSELFIKEKLSESKIIPIRGKSHFAFHDFGLNIFNKDKYFLTVKCGKAGQNGKGGHSHNDRLSITLNSGGKDFFVDAGSQCYTSDHEKRNLYRSVKFHNTLQVGSKEQNEWLSGAKDDLFWLKNDRAKTKCTFVDDMSFSGVHFAYGPSHIRTIKAEDNIIFGKDICRSSESKSLLFNLHPDVAFLEIGENTVLLENKDKKVRLSWSDGKLIIADSLFSSFYGVAAKSKRIEIAFFESNIDWKIEFCV